MIMTKTKLICIVIITEDSEGVCEDEWRCCLCDVAQRGRGLLVVVVRVEAEAVAIQRKCICDAFRTDQRN